MSLPEAVAAYRDAERTRDEAEAANMAAYKAHCRSNTTRSLRAWEATIDSFHEADGVLVDARNRLVTAALAHDCEA